MRTTLTRAGWAASTLVALPLAASAQEYADLTGRIVDGETGGPVTAAAVQVVGRAGVVETDPDGTFLIEAVRVDQLTLLVQRLGYYPLRVHLRLESGGESVVPLQDPLPLRPVPIELRELIVELQDPWLEAPFQSRSFYRRERLFTRTDLERTPYQMQSMLSNLAGAAPAGCEFDFYVDGRWIHPSSVRGLVMNRAPVEFEAAEVYLSNARMGQRESVTSPFRPEGSGADSPTGNRDLSGMPCGVFRLWSLGHRQLGDHQYVGPMDEALMGPLQAGMGEVQGLVAGSSERPVPGILLTLLDELGAPAAAAVTDAQGRYVLRVPAPGTYMLVVVRPGMPEWRSEPFVLEEGQVLDITPRSP